MTQYDADRFQATSLQAILAEGWLSFLRRLRSRRLRGPLLYTISSFVSVFVTAVSGLIVARWVLPEALGTWHSVVVILPYLSLLSLGLPQSGGRQFAFFSGAGEQTRALEVANVAFTYTLLWSIISILITVTVMFFAWNKNSNSQTMLAFVLFLIVAGSNPFSKFLHNLYRNGKEFGKLGVIQFVESAYNFISIAFIYFGGWTGLFIRYATIALLSATLRFFFCPVPLRLQFSWSVFRSLFKMGLPRLAITVIANLFLAADRTLIVTGLGKEAMGFYALALLAERAIGVMPLSLTQIVQTHMTVRYGRTKTIKSLQRITFLPVLFNAVVLLIPTFLAILLIAPFINAFLPNYKPGIDAARLTILSGYFSSLRTSGGLFGALDRMYGYMILSSVSLCLMYLLGWIGLELYGTIESVATAKVITMAFSAISINVMAYFYISNGDRIKENVVVVTH